MKVAALFTILVLVLTGISSAFALEVDLSTISNDELILLNNQIKAELGKRNIEVDNLISNGVYVVGKDIRADQYLLTAVLTDYGMTIITFETEDCYNAYFSTKRFTVGEENAAVEANANGKIFIRNAETATLNLHDGMVLLIKDGVGSLEVVTPSWAP
ncbi:MAG: hypothetical protein J6K73_04550 [Clostridia bacterium]|nr:hypothetical protein [Clostridia bacterium]